MLKFVQQHEPKLLTPTRNIVSLIDGLYNFNFALCFSSVTAIPFNLSG